MDDDITCIAVMPRGSRSRSRSHSSSLDSIVLEVPVLASTNRWNQSKSGRESPLSISLSSSSEEEEDSGLRPPGEENAADSEVAVVFSGKKKTKPKDAARRKRQRSNRRKARALKAAEENKSPEQKSNVWVDETDAFLSNISVRTTTVTEQDKQQDTHTN